MKQATVKVYIRFGEIPPDGISHVHLGDYDARPEGGLSVWRAVKSNGCYYPVLPEDANEDAIADYFDMLLTGRQRVYLVTGQEMRLEGADREPLLMMPVTVLKEITHYIHPEVWKETEEYKKQMADIKRERAKEKRAEAKKKKADINIDKTKKGKKS